MGPRGCSFLEYAQPGDIHAAFDVRMDASMPSTASASRTTTKHLAPSPILLISRRLGRSIPHLTFFDQSSFNTKIRDSSSIYPYIGRFGDMEMRWSVFGEMTKTAFQKAYAKTSASFQHGLDTIAACQEHVINRNVEGLLREMIRLREILEACPPPSPPSIRTPTLERTTSRVISGLQFPPFLVMDAFLDREKHSSPPSNTTTGIPDFVRQSGDPRLMGVLDGIIEAYTGERGFMGTHRYKVVGILEIASKTGRTETNGLCGAPDMNGQPWEETHKQFFEAMKERLEPFRGNIDIEPREMRGTFEECRYKSRILSRLFVDSDPNRSITMVARDLHGTVAAALGLAEYFDSRVTLNAQEQRFARHLGSVRHSPTPHLTLKDILCRGHLAPITQELALNVHDSLQASSNTVLQVLSTTEWPIRGTLGDLLQAAVTNTNPHIW
ncbi:hypothetical protein VTI74DRAFT_5972 [Chaetomium olivicolor]